MFFFQRKKDTRPVLTQDTTFIYLYTYRVVQKNWNTFFHNCTYALRAYASLRFQHTGTGADEGLWQCSGPRLAPAQRSRQSPVVQELLI